MSGTEVAIVEGLAFLVIVLLGVFACVGGVIQWWRNR